jgi:pSer/pThr/pTyr-binding forkhead associated (FHA) protein
LRIATDEEAAMTEPDEGTGQQGEQNVAPAAGGPDTTMSLHPVPVPESAEAAESGLSSADRTAIDALPEGSALLVVQRGPNSGARFLLDSEKTTAGRRPDSDIFLDDVTVSRRHAEFVRRPGGVFVVRDVGSLNGTYVQRDRIDEVVLRDGDEVQIGKYRMVFHPSPRGGGAGAGW